MWRWLKFQPMVHQSPVENIEAVYNKYKWRALIGAFLCYMSYYFVRYQFEFSSPDLIQNLGLSKTEIGMLVSFMFISYGLSKGFLSILADKTDPKKFMILGLILSAIISIIMGTGAFIAKEYSGIFLFFGVLLILNGLVQGMGVAPSCILIASWFPKKYRGRAGAFWNVSHNVGGASVALIAMAASTWFHMNWLFSAYIAPALCAIVVAIFLIFYAVSTPLAEGLPPLETILNEKSNIGRGLSEIDHAPENITSWQILYKYVLTNKCAWYVSLLDTFVYMIRFGIITWIPIYLLQVKGFSKGQMAATFSSFELAAVFSTLFAGWLTDTIFKGRRMPLCIISMVLITLGIFFYATSTNLLVIGLSATFIGCLIYIPQFLAYVQTMEIVPTFAIGSAVGLRGLMSYIVGSTGGTALFGFVVENSRFGWNGGFALLFGAVLFCTLFAWLLHRSVLKMEAKSFAKNK